MPPNASRTREPIYIGYGGSLFAMGGKLQEWRADHAALQRLSYLTYRAQADLGRNADASTLIRWALTVAVDYYDQSRNDAEWAKVEKGVRKASSEDCETTYPQESHSLNAPRFADQAAYVQAVKGALVSNEKADAAGTPRTIVYPAPWLGRVLSEEQMDLLQERPPEDPEWDERVERLARLLRGDAKGPIIQKTKDLLRLTRIAHKRSAQERDVAWLHKTISKYERRADSRGHGEEQRNEDSSGNERDSNGGSDSESE